MQCFCRIKYPNPTRFIKSSTLEEYFEILAAFSAAFEDCPVASFHRNYVYISQNTNS